MEISKTIVINASLEVVFKAISRPEELIQWFPDKATLESKVGGKVIFTTLKERHPEYSLERNYVMEGTVLDFVPNKKLSYTWTFNDVPAFPKTAVTWELESVEPDSNKTRVRLTHVGFTGEEKGNTSFESHNEGWTQVLSKLAKYCDRRK
jgi:uncharacterized protein YndB with AHSA1/START domain